MKTTEQRKYLVWVGGSYNAFDNLLDAEIEKKEWEYKGYTDIQIETTEQKKYFVNDVINAGHNIEPLTCLNCNSQEVTFNQHLNDAYCSECGTWQDE